MGSDDFSVRWTGQLQARYTETYSFRTQTDDGVRLWIWPIGQPMPATPLIDAWFRLAFGCQAVWAVREVASEPEVDFGGTIRPATPDEAGGLAK